MTSFRRAVATHTAAAASGALAFWYIFNARQGVDGSGNDKDGKSSQLRPMRPSLSPTSPIAIFRPRNDLEIAFDTRLRNPVYVMERLGDAAPESGTRNRRAVRDDKKFREEQSLRPEHRSRNSSYRNSGYDRGHLAPAADYQHDDDAMTATFTLCNVSPQVASFNRSLWLRLEQLVRQVAKEEREINGHVTYVVNGPLWLPSGIVRGGGFGGAKDKFRFSYYAIGSPPSIVSVPTHFFKVVVVVDESERDPDLSRLVKFAAFVLPNDEPNKKSEPLSKYLVRVTDLEAVSGMSFFPAFWGRDVDEVEGPRALADLLTEDLWIEAQRTNSPGDLGAIRTTAVSKRRRQQVRDTVKDRSVLPFEHICTSRNCR